ncbi:MAG: hypothetical protein KME28_19000 [Pelatocladus maniniholoensis HA4357-MV3]|jgi:hypothetical protein|uniref:Uncharacterized protein n=1 Tax=Pelatocladus maniniholoensis HA4357-MV3 TaxID=1117104 RepID=A0A9E3HA92_9NOST|nr:hypothetical protein [Pelatocladus maniniholoensis HA4357-MV3]MBW4433743.1 hypothetical protein [Pelatocladus maniniholoensis HA4357-MV3]BAZ68773.1 hypothetical protein NIES4106_35390 [Fischerella sp. NIES-4106]BAZ68774.1 hypothetical protein NIES4106_35400 [Fischerella sp. NIES-4106]
MIISDLNHIESVESNQVVGGCGHRYYGGYGKKYDGYGGDNATAVAVAIAAANSDGWGY